MSTSPATTVGDRVRAYLSMPTSWPAFWRGVVIALVVLTLARLLGAALGLDDWGFGWELLLVVAVAVVVGLVLRAVQGRRPTTAGR